MTAGFSWVPVNKLNFETNGQVNHVAIDVCKLHKVTVDSQVLCKASAGLSALYYLNCLGDQCHIYYYLMGAMWYTNCSSSGSLVFAHLGGM